MQTDLANEGMQGVPIEADARAVRPYRSSGSPAWYYSLLTTHYYLLLTTYYLLLTTYYLLSLPLSAVIP